MKTILFDHQIFESQPYGGISQAYIERIPLLKKYYNCVVAVTASNNAALVSNNIVDNLRPIKDVNLDFFTQYHIPLKRTITNILNNRIHNQINTIRYLKKGDYDVFDPTYYNPYFLKYIGNKPYVLEIHDMIPEKIPMYYQDGVLVSNKKKLIDYAAHIHTPSAHTKKDIIELYDVLPEKITVTSRGIPTMPHNISEPFFHFPYLLYVGARWDYKNFVPFINDFAKVSNEYPDIHLVCTWKPFNESEKKIISELKIQNKVHHFSPSFKQFHSLYHNAIAFVFPSMYEGFGLPILEAFSCGCPVILNDASCFPEIAGDAALYVKFNERNNDFYDVFKYVWELSNDDRQTLIEKGYQRMKLYSWEESAKRLAKIYESVC